MVQRLSLCMIVRDEEALLPRCLESVRDLVDEIVVVDTGSRDRTIEIAHRYGAILKEIPWQNDFAAARNASLELATGDWILWLDADEELLPESGAALPSLLSDPTVEGYFIQMRHLIGSRTQPDVEVSTLFRLWRNRPAYRFTGAVHEQILPAILAANPQARTAHSGIQAVHYGYLNEVKAAKGKQQRNRRLLEARLAENPHDAFALFNLGIEHYVERRFQEALTAFEAALAHAKPGDPWRPKLIKGYAATLHELQAWDTLFALLQEEIRRYPDYTDLYFIEGAARTALGQHEAAAAAYARCLELGPAPSPPYTSTDPGTGSYKAHLALGRTYEALGMYAEAREAYACAARSRPGWHDPLKLLAALLGRQADDATVLRELERFFPENTYEDQVKIATLLIHAGRPRLAIERLLPLHTAQRLERSGRYVLALCLAEVGEDARALEILQANWEESPLEVQVRALRRALEHGCAKPDTAEEDGG